MLAMCVRLEEIPCDAIPALRYFGPRCFYRRLLRGLSYDLMLEQPNQSSFSTIELESELSTCWPSCVACPSQFDSFSKARRM